MDPDTGGQFGSDPQRQAAAEIARKKVLAAYAEVAQKTAGADEGDRSHLKSQPMNAQINSESWKRYHSAWQNYYQKYYNDYYSNAARDYIAKERLKDARAAAENDEIAYALARAGRGVSGKTGLKLPERSAYDSSDNRGGEESKLRETIRKKATDNAKKSRRFRKFVPLVAGVTVTLVILFLQYNRLVFAPLMAYVSPGNAPANSIEAIDPTITQSVSEDPRLIIPKLNIDVPIQFDATYYTIYQAMNNGVAHYRLSGASAYPGQIGNFIITGHSAGDVYTANPYKYIFSGLERLEEGDLIYVNYKAVRYTYKMTKREVVEPSNVAALVVQTNKPLITLVTCTPLGTSRYRLLITGEQISPAYDESSRNEQEADSETIITDEGNLELPANEPSFFERIWNWLTGQ